MPPIVNPAQRIDAYERGHISVGLLASDLIAGAVEMLPAELVKMVSARILELIHGFVMWAGEGTSITVGSASVSVEGVEPSLPEELQFWLQGRAMWREYFEGLGT